MNSLVIALAVIMAGRASSAVVNDVHETVLFRGGEAGYRTYRIPALAVTTKGTVLAFCEGRKGGMSDAGDIDLALRRSTDNGETWGPMQVVVDDGEMTCGNPCPIVDRKTGAVVLLITKNGRDDLEGKIMQGTAPPRTVWVLRSDDEGDTWSAPRDISASVRKPDFRWYATGPGHGIQLKDGRMIAPCDHSTGPKPEEVHSHVIYSDDGGTNWSLGGELEGKTDECTAVALTNGGLYLNARSNFGLKQRAFAVSLDRGLTFPALAHDAALVEPTCEGSALDAMRGASSFVLFSNPASVKRENLTVRASRDNGKTWPVAKALWPGPAAYSDLAQLADGRIACLYERGEKNPYETLTLARFPADWLLGP